MNLGGDSIRENDRHKHWMQRPSVAIKVFAGSASTGSDYTRANRNLLSNVSFAFLVRICSPVHTDVKDDRLKRHSGNCGEKWTHRFDWPEIAFELMGWSSTKAMQRHVRRLTAGLLPVHWFASRPWRRSPFSRRGARWRSRCRGYRCCLAGCSES